MGLSRQAWILWRSLAGALLWIGVVSVGHAVAQPAGTEGIVTYVDIGWRPASRTFAGTTLFPLFSELGNFEADYRIQGGGILGGGISFPLWRDLAVGFDVSSYRAIHPARITSELPHPLFFDFHRWTTGVAGGLERRELGVHFRGIWMTQLSDWLVFSLSGGPSLIAAKQEFVSTVEHTEVGFPFIELIFAGHTVTAQSAKTLAVNAGVSIDTFALHKVNFLQRYQFMERVGLGLLIRYVRGSVNMRVDDVGMFNVDLGGVQLTTGLRFRF